MDINAIKRQLRIHEGMRLKPYRCTAGRLTIGIGRNLEDRGITESEAMMLLGNDIEHVLTDARAFPWFDSLDEVRQRVVVDMIFNLGATGFKQFKQTIVAISTCNYDGAARHMLASLWARQVGVRADRLAWMMRTGKVHRDLL